MLLKKLSEKMAKASSSLKVGFLIDLSGTLHIDSTPTPGAIEALKRLREKQYPIRFITNTTKESRSKLVSRLSSIGFDIKSEEVFTSLIAAREHILKNGLRPKLFLEKEALEDFEGIDTSNPNSVLIGLNPSGFHYENLNDAMRILLNGGKLVAVHKARYFARSDGLALGPGAFVSALEYSTGVNGEIVGKLSPTFFNLVLQDIQMLASDCIMIGDDIQDDIEGAKKLGMKGYLVRTGKWRKGDEELSDVDGTFENFASAVNYIITQEKTN